MAAFDIALRTVPVSTFTISMGYFTGGGGGGGFTPPTIDQIYPRSDYGVGSSYGVVTGQLWPRGTGHQL